MVSLRRVRARVQRFANGRIVASSAAEAMGALFRRFRRAVAPEPPLRDELLSIERLEERAKSLAARFTVAPLRQRVEPRVPATRATTHACCAPRTPRWPTTSIAGQLVTPAAEWLLDHFHLVDGRDPRHPPESAARVLPRAAAPAAAPVGRAHADLRDGPRAHPAQRQPARSLAARPVHEQLPVGRAADDRRAVGVAEHPEARADRKPPPAGRRNDRGAGVAGRGRRRRERMRGRAPAAVARRAGRSGVRRPPAAAGARIRPAPAVAARRDRERI